MSMTGDPARTKAGDFATEEQIEAMREQMGLNDPITVRFGRWISDVILHGDFGEGLYGDDCWEGKKKQDKDQSKIRIITMTLNIFINI